MAARYQSQHGDTTKGRTSNWIVNTRNGLPLQTRFTSRNHQQQSIGLLAPRQVIPMHHWMQTHAASADIRIETNNYPYCLVRQSPSSIDHRCRRALHLLDTQWG